MNVKVKIDVNEVLDDLLKSRRSIRRFSKEIPSKKMVEAVIEAGRLAPYAVLAVAGQADFRHFFVVSENSEAMERVGIILRNVIKSEISAYERHVGENEPLPSFISSLKGQREKGVMGVGTAPYFVIVAERRGMPAIEQKSLSHVMQNMWLKATALDLGFELVSAIGRLSGNKEFCDVLGVPTGEYGFDACAIGYPDASTKRVGRAVPHPSVCWL